MGAKGFERPAKQALMLAIEPRVKREVRSIPVSSPVATFKQSENVAIAHLAGARAVACYEGCGLCNHFNLRMRTVLTNGHLAQVG